MDKKIILGATNKVAAIFSQYANNFAVRRNILPFVKWCHKKQPAGDNAKGESMYHLSQCLIYISSMLKETDKKQSDDFQELYKKSCENPEQLKLISVYDALIRSWDMIKDSTYTYRCLHDLVMLTKTEWNLDEIELNNLDKIELNNLDEIELNNLDEDDEIF